MDLAKALREHNQHNRLVERGIVAESIADALLDSLMPRGTFNIPMLLDERRFAYGIPNGAFAQYPAFDKVYIWQIPTKERRTYAQDGQLVMPDAVVSADRNTAPRGIIVSAGLQAMDSLRSTGIDLGHIVRFKKFSPFIQPIDEINGTPLAVMVIRDGDIVSSEDLATEYHARRVSIVNVAEDKMGYDFRFSVEKDGVMQTTGKKISGYYDPST